MDDSSVNGLFPHILQPRRAGPGECRWGAERDPTKQLWLPGWSLLQLHRRPRRLRSEISRYAKSSFAALCPLAKRQRSEVVDEASSWLRFLNERVITNLKASEHVVPPVTHKHGCAPNCSRCAVRRRHAH